MHPPSRASNSSVRLLAILLSALLVSLSCNLPSANSEIVPQSLETQAPVIQATASEDPIDLAGPAPKLGDTLRWVDGSLLVFIPPGEFIMGYGAENNPEHTVYLDGFWIYRTEVTNRMYWRCMVMGECSPPVPDEPPIDLEQPDVANLPVINVRWDQAEQYCKFVGGHLPSEAQWEKTARGPDGNLYPWGDGEPTCDLLNFNDCFGETRSVVAYLPGASTYNVLDMAGNVFEWVADWYQENYYVESPVENPWGPEFGEVRSVRGSSFETGPGETASALRHFLDPEKYRSDLGFRCVVDDPYQYAPLCEVLAYVPPEQSGDSRTGPGGSAACIVPQPELDVVTYCNQGLRGNNISWTPADAEIDYSAHEGVSCTQYDQDTLACSSSPGGSVTVKACKSCPPPVVELGVIGVCDSPYALDEPGGLCRYAGAQIPGAAQCTPGHSLLTMTDAVCCQMDIGSPQEFPVCAPGGRYEAIPNICWFTLPSVGDKKCASETVYFHTCRRPNNGGDASDDDCELFCYSTGAGQSCFCLP